MDIEGLVYLLNQTGVGLAQANAELARLRQENAQLRAKLGERSDGAATL